MITPDYCLLMARYSRWMNERLYALLAEFDDAERRRDRGAFFGSIHGTLNLLLWGDLKWLGPFIDEPCTAPAFSAAMQFFNHGTHHRGQLTTLMKQAGRDPGVTDLPWLPGVVRIVDAPPG